MRLNTLGGGLILFRRLGKSLVNRLRNTRQAPGHLGTGGFGGFAGSGWAGMGGVIALLDISGDQNDGQECIEKLHIRSSVRPSGQI